jgi:hypothetical protein
MRTEFRAIIQSEYGAPEKVYLPKMRAAQTEAIKVVASGN